MKIDKFNGMNINVIHIINSQILNVNVFKEGILMGYGTQPIKQYTKDPFVVTYKK